MALRDQPYIPLYVQDFLTDEKLAYCSASATGVYIRVMCLMHKSEHYGKILLKQKFKQGDKQLKNFASQLAIQLPYDFNTILCALEELVDSKVLSEEPCALIQKRMVKDNEISELRAKAGRKGGVNSLGKKGKKTSKKKDDFASKFAQAKTQANTEYENEYENEIIDKGGMGGKDVILDDIYPFEEFWDDYGKKCGEKDKLIKKWGKISNKDKLAIRDYIPLYKQAQPDKKFRKNPETFLNNKSWNDEIIENGNDNRSKEVKRANSETDRLEWLARKAEEAFAS